MANDGTVKIGTELDQTGLKSGLSGLGSFASKGFGAIGSAAAGMAGITVGALAAVATGMGAAVTAGVKYNAQMENYTASFATMLGSEEAAIAKVAELKEMGAKTPFEMGDLATATTTLLQYGIAADSSKDILSTLGDISLGNAEKLQGLTNVYGKMNSTGKLTGETLEGMISNGFNPLNVISAKTGESMDQLRDRMSKGGISAEEVAEAFKTATSEGGQFYKGMETASTTFDGLISTLKDNANSLVGEVVKPISDSLTKTLLPEAIGMVSTLTDAFQKDGIPGLIDAAGSVVGQIISGIAAEAPKVIEMASGFLTTLLNALIANLPALATAGLGIITALTNSLTANLPLLVTIALSLITTLMTGLLQAAPSLIIAGMNTLVMFIQGIAAALPGLIAYLPGIITTIVNVLVENLPLIIDAAIQILLALVTGITTALPMLIEMLPTIISSMVTTLLENLPAIIQCAIALLVALITGLSQAIPQLIEMLPTIIATIVKVLIDNLPLILEAAVQIIMALITGLVDAIPELVLMIPQIINAIKEAFEGYDWATLGTNIIEGVKNGITDAAGALGNAAKQAAEDALNAVKNFLGIHSPSKVFQKIIGRQIPAGAAKGVDDNADMLADSTVNAAGGALDAMQSASARDMVSQMQGQALSMSVPSRSAMPMSSNGNSSKDSTLTASDIANIVSAQLSKTRIEIEGRPFGRAVSKLI